MYMRTSGIENFTQVAFLCFVIFSDVSSLFFIKWNLYYYNIAF